MTERLTSPDEAEYLRSVLMRAVDKIENRSALTRAEIGAAMVGIGGGLVGAHAGSQRCLAVLDSARDAMLADNQANKTPRGGAHYDREGYCDNPNRGY